MMSFYINLCGFFLGGGRGKQSSTVILMVFLDTLRFRSFSFLSPIGVNEVDYSLYPNRKLQEQWLRSYLEAYKEYKGFGTEVSEKEVEVLYVQVNQFALVNSNLWIWMLNAVFFFSLWANVTVSFLTCVLCYVKKNFLACFVKVLSFCVLAPSKRSSEYSKKMMSFLASIATGWQVPVLARAYSGSMLNSS